MLGTAPMPAGVPIPQARAARSEPAREGGMADAGRAYAELRRRVVAAGLLQRAYRYYAWRGGLSFLLLGVAVGAGLLLPAGPGAGLLAACLVAFGSIQVALVGHDAGHLAVFGSTRANWALGWVCWSLVLGVGFWYWYDRHTRHHARTNDLAADPDLQWAGLVAYSDAAVRARPRRARWLIRRQAVLGPAYTLALAFAFRAEGWAFAARRLRGRRRAAEMALLLLSVLLWVLPALALGWAWIGTFLLAQVLAGLYLALAIAPNHKGMPTWPAGTPLAFLERQVLSSRNIPPHPVTDFVFGGLNYQIEHHLFPTMPRANFGRARAIVKPFCLGRGLPYQEMGLLASYRLVLAELQRVGRSAVAEWA
jgi:fatty acid desaturase